MTVSAILSSGSFRITWSCWLLFFWYSETLHLPLSPPSPPPNCTPENSRQVTTSPQSWQLMMRGLRDILKTKVCVFLLLSINVLTLNYVRHYPASTKRDGQISTGSHILEALASIFYLSLNYYINVWWLKRVCAHPHRRLVQSVFSLFNFKRINVYWWLNCIGQSLPPQVAMDRSRWVAMLPPSW